MNVSDPGISRPTATPFLTSPPGLGLPFLEPAGLRWGRFTASDGASLRWSFLPGEPGGLCVDCILLGGFTEFIEKYFETMRELTRRGISIWSLDWREQGGSVRRHVRPAARDFDQDAEDLASFIEKHMPRDAARPRLVIAHSMGAAIALLALGRKPDLADAAVLSAPMLDLETAPLPRIAARTLAWLARAFGAKHAFIPGAGPWKFDDTLGPHNSITSHDHERCRIQQLWFHARPHLRIDGPTFDWVNAAFALSARLNSRDFLKGVTTAILLGSAGRERLVCTRAQRRAAALLPHCRLVEFPDAKHELLLETETIRARWFAEIDAFLATKFDRAAP